MQKLSISTLAALVAASMTLPVTASAADMNYKVTDKPLELTIHLHTKKYVYNDDWPVEKRAQELTNVSLKNVASMATNKSEEAFNLLIASGDLPDIVGGSSLKENVNQYGPQGAFLPLNDLIEEHAPNLKAFFDANKDILNAISAADGNLYFIPYVPDGKFARAYFIRQDWLKAVGKETPQNIDELHDVLVAFRDGDPNGNGKKDEIPLFARQWEELIRLVTLWDGRVSGSDTYHDFYVQDGEIRHGYSEEGYKVGISNLAKWYAEGLIDPEVFTRGSRAREYLLSNDLGGMTHDWFASTSSYNDSVSEKIPEFSFKAFIPPEGISGKRVEANRRTKVKPEGWAISYTNEHPVETIKYFDFWFTEEGRNLSNFGIEGVHYDLVDGKATFKPEILNAGTPINTQMWQVGAQVQRGFYQDYEYERQWSNKHALEGIALYEAGDYLLEPYMGVAFVEDEKKVYDKYWPSIKTYMLEMQQAWILGTSDVNEDWDKYQSQLERLGYSKVMKVMESAYERQYGS
ncbi:extracellular solute-binding protein [Alginatibacterium sediminis]|uniref:Extracellular solute-binding protein n=1 Tax=Alginatibacterium sediminis TaxID=2164068 RepID=A0A420EH46_9ALTE|nr:extracellular solute-binding protein [Alginatibacterium sediminis]RKF20003.1 extracellular solute-binding protein [Alginatibacterium sediminis]